MDVAILYSGGKDSTFAIQHAIEKGWNIRYLISIKPTRKDCYLFHYATVEHTKDMSAILGIPHIYAKCSVAHPVKEANIIKEIVLKNQKNNNKKNSALPNFFVDAVVLGGTGLQETQLSSIQKALHPLNVEVFASHSGEEHDVVMEEMLDKGYEIMITQIASDGLKNWLGKKLTRENFAEFKADSMHYGFHVGGEGGYYDTLVLDAPIFPKRLDVSQIKIITEDTYCGHVVLDKYNIVNKKKLDIKQ